MAVLGENSDASLCAHSLASLLYLPMSSLGELARIRNTVCWVPAFGIQNTVEKSECYLRRQRTFTGTRTQNNLSELMLSLIHNIFPACDPPLNIMQLCF